MKISVIICTYNYGHLLPDALRSVAAQTVCDFELLVVDDGSSDNTEEVVRQFTDAFPRCVYLKKPHTGAPDSRNVGVRATTGTHIAFLDADDLWAPDYLEIHQKIFEANPQAELCYLNALQVHADGRVYGPFFSDDLPPICGRLLAGEWFSYFILATSSTMMLTRALYDRIGPFDTRFRTSSEDWDWVLRAAMAGAFCVRLPKAAVLYRVHGANRTTQSNRFFEDWLSLCETTLLSQTQDPSVHRSVRGYMRQWLARLLANYPPATGRVLVSEARRVFPADNLLKAMYLSTYFGSTYLLKVARFLKRSWKRLTQSSRRVDLSAPPEVLFASVVEKPAGKV